MDCDKENRYGKFFFFFSNSNFDSKRLRKRTLTNSSQETFKKMVSQTIYDPKVRIHHTHSSLHHLNTHTKTDMKTKLRSVDELQRRLLAKTQVSFSPIMSCLLHTVEDNNFRLCLKSLKCVMLMMEADVDKFRSKTRRCGRRRCSEE